MGCIVTSDLFPPPNQRDREHLDLTKPLDLISNLKFFLLQPFVLCIYGCGCECGSAHVPTCM